MNTIEHEEEWRWIPGHEGRYQVSDLGRIRFLSNSVAACPLSTPQDSHGYPYVCISQTRGGQKKTHRVHNLVMKTFVGPCPEGLEVRHLNGDKIDTRLANLKYGTHAENITDAVKHGTHFQVAKIECKHGHEYTEVNTYQGRTGRECRTCRAGRVTARRKQVSA